MKEKVKVVEIGEELHKTIKANAAIVGVSMKKYISLCIIQCKTDVKG